MLPLLFKGDIDPIHLRFKLNGRSNASIFSMNKLYFQCFARALPLFDFLGGLIICRNAGANSICSKPEGTLQMPPTGKLVPCNCAFALPKRRALAVFLVCDQNGTIAHCQFASGNKFSAMSESQNHDHGGNNWEC